MSSICLAMRRCAEFTALALFLGCCDCVTELKKSFVVDFFRYKNVNHVCLFVCDDGDPLLKTMVDSSFTVNAINIKGFAGTADADEENLRRCLFQYYVNVGVFVRASCPGFEGVMYKASQYLLLDSAHYWLIEDEVTQERLINETHLARERLIYDEISTYTNISHLEENGGRPLVLNHLNISVDADITIALPNGSAEWLLFDVYNFGRVQGGGLNFTEAGAWSSEAGLSVKSWLNSYKYERRRDFYNFSFRSIVVSSKPKLFRPEMIQSFDRNEDISAITQISALILEILAERHNFRFSYAACDRWIGTFDANSTRVAANSLYFRERDLTPLLRVSPELLTWIDFVGVPVTSIETRYYYRIPDYGVGKFENQFLTPFTARVWWCSLGTFALCAAALALSSALERRPLALQFSVFSVLALVCQQFFDDNNGDQRRVFSARRLSVFVTATSCLLLYNFYTSSVVSWLLNGPPATISSLQGLLESPLELIFEDIGYTKSWLQVPDYYFNKKNARIESALRERKVLSKKKDDPLLMTVDEGIRLVKAGGYAFHAQVAPAHERISRTFDARELCQLGSLGSMEPCSLYPALPRRSPYKAFFLWGLSHLRERGLASRVQRRLGAPGIACDGATPRPLALGGAAPAFALLAAGAVLAAAALAAECAVARARAPRNRRESNFE